MIATDQADPAEVSEAAARLLVGDELDGAEKSDRADLADEWMVLEFRQHLGERWRAELLHAGNKPLLLHDLDVLERDGAGHGVAGEGIAVMEILLVRHELIDDLVIDHDA